MDMHLQFTDELQRRLASGQIDLNTAERAILWRSQMRLWLGYLNEVPLAAQPLIHQAVSLIGQAAFLVENGLESSSNFDEITTELYDLSEQIAEWAH